MVDLAEIQAIYYMVAATGVLVAAAYYVMTLRTTQRNSKSALETRQAQLYMQIYNEFKSKEMSEADYDIIHLELRTIDDWKRLLEDKTRYAAWNQWAGYYEGIGVMVRENLLEVRFVAELFSGPFIWFWEKFRPMFTMMRRELNFPRAGVEMEYLYDKIMEYSRMHPEFKVSSPVMNPGDNA